MQTFTIYAAWKPDGDAAEPLLGSVADAMIAADPDRCVWMDDRKPGVVQLSFDIRGNDYDDAVESARRVLVEIVPSSGLPGTLTEVTAMSDEGQVIWTA